MVQVASTGPKPRYQKRLVVLSTEALSFSKVGSSTVLHRILLHDIEDVKRLESAAGAVHAHGYEAEDMHLFCISCRPADTTPDDVQGSTTVLRASSDEERNRWVDTIDSTRRNQRNLMRKQSNSSCIGRHASAFSSDCTAGHMVRE